ncbi:MAG: serine/threonine protein kinase [Gemmatimonadetes bacterium]|nr:serine/threonine protein kinase [Gemmatimonadota bacterium]
MLTPDAPARGQEPRDGAHGADAAMLRDRVTAAIGEQYLVGDEVGRGGMAVVYAAEDVRLQRQVALKVLPPDLAFRVDVRERFVREAQTAARLNHPHIVPIYAVHEVQGLVCFAMALVRGESLAAWVNRVPRPDARQVAHVLEHVADALAYAHAAGIVHRDIKPDNVLIDRESGRAMVTDFGIARAAEGGSRLTQTGIAVGTPAFMSPEQAMGDREVDGRSDLYALGIVGYLLLAGRLPFEAASTPAMLMKHVSETPPPLRSMRADIPRALTDIIEQCLAKRPQDRFPNALALRDALRRVQRDGSLGVVDARPAFAPQAPQSRPPAPPVWRDAGDGAPARLDDRPERYGHRSEDWAPRRVVEPELASLPASRDRARDDRPPAGALPPVPQLPPLPASADRGTRREWQRANKEAIRDWRRQVREARRTASYQVQPGNLDPVPPQELAHRFRMGALRNAAIAGALVVFNANMGGPPWSLFPAMGLGLGTLAHYARLRSRGMRLRHVAGLGNPAPASVVEPATPAKIAGMVSAFRRHLKWLGGAVATAAVSFFIGGAFSLDAMIPPFVLGLIGTMAAGQMTMMDWLRLRRHGISAGDAWSDRWRALAATADTRPFETRVHERLALIAGDNLLDSRFGETLRSAVEDRVAIGDVCARLSDAERAMVPDVEPTADALLERIGSLTAGLERLDRDLPGDALPQLLARIAAVEAEPDHAPDRERRLTLLTRQRSALEELAGRRDTMQRQVDSATLALRSLRLDLAKLRAIGVDATDVTTATQEARALSRDLGFVLDAADEARRL